MCLGIKARLPTQPSPLFKDSKLLMVHTMKICAGPHTEQWQQTGLVPHWMQWQCNSDDEDEDDRQRQSDVMTMMTERHSLTRRWWSAAPHSPARWSAAVHIYKFANWMGWSVVRSWAQSSQDGTDSKDYCSIHEGFSALGRLRLMLNCLRVASRAAALPLK